MLFSLQVYLSQVQVEEGYECENKFGIVINLGEWNYCDVSYKFEFVCVLSLFDVFYGFWWCDESQLLFKFVGFVEFVVLFDGFKVMVVIFKFFMYFLCVFKLEGQEFVECVVMVVVWYWGDLVFDWVMVFFIQFLGDLMCIVLFFFNVVYLEFGELFFIEVGILYFYLFGMVIEIMVNLDNVVCVGFILKYVDFGEFLCVLIFFEVDVIVCSGFC